MIELDWPGEPAVRHACLVLLEGLRTRPLLDHYTLGTLEEIADVGDDRTLARAVMYLALPKIGVLAKSLMYEDADGFFRELDETAVADYAMGRGCVHPRSGIPMEDDDLLIVFVPGPQLGKDDSK
jgi:hypothetical protein